MSFFSIQLPGLVASKPVEPEVSPSVWTKAADSLDQCSQMGFMQRMAGFALCVTAALFFLVSCLYSIPLIMLGRPDKFAVPFVIANVLMLVSTCFLSGLRTQISNIFASERRIASITYLVSMCATLYLALFVQRWYLVLPMIAVQVLSLVWYGLSYIPMGHAMMARFMSCLFGCCRRGQASTSLV